MKIMNKLAIVWVMMILGTGLVAWADDSYPPAWRGASASTFQEWDFSIDDKGPMTPDSFTNPYGDPLLMVDSSCTYVQGIGAWKLVGEIDVDVPNSNITGPDTHKEILLQLTWLPGVVKSFLPFQPIIGITADPFGSMDMIRQDHPLGGSGWVVSEFKIKLSPNPSEEWFTIKGNITVDQLVIDTICIPEPATICLLGLGALSIIRKRNSRN